MRQEQQRGLRLTLRPAAPKDLVARSAAPNARDGFYARVTTVVNLNYTHIFLDCGLRVYNCKCEKRSGGSDREPVRDKTSRPTTVLRTALQDRCRLRHIAERPFSTNNRCGLLEHPERRCTGFQAHNMVLAFLRKIMSFVV